MRLTVNAGSFMDKRTVGELQNENDIDIVLHLEKGKSADVKPSASAMVSAGDILVLFAEGTSSDGASVRPFKTAFFGAAELPQVKVQPVTIAYDGHRNMPMNRRLRPHYAWYGDMDLPPHLWEALAAGPIEVTVVCHPPLAPDGDRKGLARRAEAMVREGLVRALHGGREMG